LLPSVAEIKVDWRVLAFASGAALTTGLLFGLAPAWQSRKVDVNSTLKEGGDKGGAARGRLRGALVVAEVALSLALLVGAGLLTRTFANLMGVEPGFDPRGVLTCQVVLDGPRYDTTQEAAAFYGDALERIGHLPGVEAAGVINKLPLDWQFRMPVALPEKPDQTHMTQFRMISPDYFRAMKIAVRQGRAFTDADNAAAAPVVIVNEAFAQRFFDGRDALSRQILIRRDATPQVVGVVADVKQEGLDKASPPMVFVPIPQMSDRLMAAVRTFTPSYFTVRAAGSPRNLPAGFMDTVKREIAAVDATVAISQVHSMEEIMRRSIASQRFNMLLVGLFAGLGLLLAGVGIYGVVSYSVAQRTNEIGIRIALGARAADVVRLILKHGLALAAIGVAIGLSASFALTRLMKGLLFGVSATDPLTFAAIALLLIGVALMACWIPARRAARVDPLVALRRD
jgi:predicted permease